MHRRAAEVEAVAAVHDRRQDLVGLGRGQHEDRVRRRLLERLEERVPRRRREHVRLVEDVDLVAAGHRRVADALAQVADVVDRVVGRGVHLDDVERRGGDDRAAGLAGAAGIDPRPGRAGPAAGLALAVQRSRQDLRHGRLAGAARADEEIRVVHATLLDRIAQRADDVLLPDDVCERAGAMTAVQRSGHGLSESSGDVGRLGLRAALLIPLGALVAWAARRRRLPQLRHRLQPALGRRRGASAPARLQRPARPHAAPAGDRARRRADAVRGLRPDALGRDRLPLAGRARMADLRARRALVRPRGRERSPRS